MVDPVVGEPVEIDPIVVESKPKRQYNRKPNKIPEAVPEPTEATEAPAEHPARRTLEV